jgi:hypothetical protein
MLTAIALRGSQKHEPWRKDFIKKESPRIKIPSRSAEAPQPASTIARGIYSFARGEHASARAAHGD